ncbi:MAG: hypothetical protein GX097_06435 [Methanomicrobiales archaeon]|nr:hypothetical protein [Methanomicrobiales archaeon]
MKMIPHLCILVVCGALLTGTAAGYVIGFTVNPPEAMAGEMVTIIGTSTIPAGYTDEAIVYRQVPNYQPRDAGRYPFTITEGGNWHIAIDTTGFVPATYKIQLPKSKDYPYGSSSVLMQTFVITEPQEPSVPTTNPTSSMTTAPTPMPTPTTSPTGIMTVLVASVIAALTCASALRRRNE